MIAVRTREAPSSDRNGICVPNIERDLVNGAVVRVGLLSGTHTEVLRDPTRADGVEADREDARQDEERERGRAHVVEDGSSIRKVQHVVQGHPEAKDVLRVACCAENLNLQTQGRGS